MMSKTVSNRQQYQPGQIFMPHLSLRNQAVSKRGPLVRNRRNSCCSGLGA